MELLQILNCAKSEVWKNTEKYFSLMAGLKLSGSELERVVQNVEEQDVLIDSLREAAKVGKGRRKNQEMEKREPKKRRKYDIELQELLYAFARYVRDRVLDYASLEAPGLCFDWESAARSWKNRSEEVDESKREAYL